MPLASWKAAIIRSWVSRTGESQPPTQANAPATLSITAPIAPSRTSTAALLAGPAPNQNGFIFNAASLTVRALLAPRCQSAQNGCAQETPTRHHSTSCWPCRHCELQFTDARAAHLNFYLSCFFGGCFTLFNDTGVILPAIVTAGARALLVFATSAHAEWFPVLAHHVSYCGAATCPELGASRK